MGGTVNKTGHTDMSTDSVKQPNSNTSWTVQLLQQQHCFKQMNSRAITTAVTLLSTFFTTQQITKTSSQTANWSIDYVFIYCLWVWLSLVAGYCSRKTRVHVPHKIRSLMDQILTSLGLWKKDCCWNEDNHVQLVIHVPSTKIDHTYKMLPGIVLDMEWPKY
jgi:hypothetical protein